MPGHQHWVEEVAGSNRERFQVYTWRLAVRTPSRARSLQSQAKESELLFRGTCILQFSDLTRNIISGDDFVGACESDHRCLSEAPCH